ncbi:MAG TPA: PepSY domain-containing protein [Chroococcales cyanobacterium]
MKRVLTLLSLGLLIGAAPSFADDEAWRNADGWRKTLNPNDHYKIPRSQMMMDNRKYNHPSRPAPEWHPGDADRRVGAEIAQPAAEDEALRHLPGAKILSTALDMNRARPAYKIKVIQGRKVEEANIDAKTGAYLGLTPASNQGRRR